MSTFLLFIDFPGSLARGASEQNCVASCEGGLPSTQALLDLAVQHLGGELECRVGVLEVENGRAKPHPCWYVQRFHTLSEMPKGAFFDYVPKTIEDVEDDMEIVKTLPPFVATFQRS